MIRFSLLSSFILFLASLIVGHFAHAEAVDVHRKKIFAILYSATDGSALVGYADSNGIAAFADCQAPKDLVNGEMRVQLLSRCDELRSSRFTMTSKNQEVINSNFKVILDQKFKDMQQKLIERHASEVAQVNRGYTALGVAALAGGSIVTYGLGTSAAKSFATSKTLTGKALNAGKIVGVAGIGLSAIAFGMFSVYTGENTYFNVQRASKVYSIEDDMIVKRKTRQSSRIEIVEYTHDERMWFYEIVRQSILEAVALTSST